MKPDMKFKHHLSAITWHQKGPNSHLSNTRQLSLKLQVSSQWDHRLVSIVPPFFLRFLHTFKTIFSFAYIFKHHTVYNTTHMLFLYFVFNVYILNACLIQHFCWMHFWWRVLWCRFLLNKCRCKSRVSDFSCLF